VVILLAARGAALVGAHNAMFFNPLPAAVGIEEPDDYRARNFPPDALYRGPARELPDEARVLVFGESRLFRFPRPTRASARVDPPAVLPFLRGAAGAPDFLANAGRAGFTHLLVSLDALRGTADTVDWRRGLTPQEIGVLAAAVQKCRPVGRGGGLVLVAIPTGAPQ